jgi:hypothetical protein
LSVTRRGFAPLSRLARAPCREGDELEAAGDAAEGTISIVILAMGI